MAMVRKRKQALLFNPGTLCEYRLDPDSFCGQLAAYRAQLFRDEDFADLYKPSDRGRPCIPPSQMAALMLLQYQYGVSDGEAVERSGCDLRWAAALGRMPGPALCARTTLLTFRSRLVVGDQLDKLFDRAIQHAKDLGILKGGKVRLLVDTRPVVGRGAVEDTVNLLARCTGNVIALLAEAAGEPAADWAAARGLGQYVRDPERSFKGGAGIDWNDPAARQRVLTELVAAARRALALADEAAPSLAQSRKDGLARETDLLRQILAQDIEESAEPEKPGEPPAAAVKEGTAPGRVPSATDEEQRHGRKSASKRFVGHKARVAVDAETQLILGAEVLAGNAGDAEGVLKQAERVEERAGVAVAETVGDCAYAGAATRREFADAGRELRAKQPPAACPADGIPKSRFRILFRGGEAEAVVCPAGHRVTERRRAKDGTLTFSFAPHCARCPLRHRCVRARRLKDGRSISVHPEERLLQAAREYQSTPEGKRTLRERVGVEHALARLARLGIGQARYFGRKKTGLQLSLCATVANLRLMWNRKAAEAAEAAEAPAGGPQGPDSSPQGPERRLQRPQTRPQEPQTAARGHISRLWALLRRNPGGLGPCGAPA
jgi:hypothetical protein